ncbi:MAG: hypothetical protein AAFY20_00270 [Cyanobacteria bacterium J06639_14]
MRRREVAPYEIQKDGVDFELNLAADKQLVVDLGDRKIAVDVKNFFQRRFIATAVECYQLSLIAYNVEQERKSNFVPELSVLPCPRNLPSHHHFRILIIPPS